MQLSKNLNPFTITFLVRVLCHQRVSVRTANERGKGKGEAGRAEGREGRAQRAEE
jgi:hypothetical protein